MTVIKEIGQDDTGDWDWDDDDQYDDSEENDNYSAYDKLYDAIINNGYVNKDGNPLITYEYNTSVAENLVSIIYEKDSNQFEIIYFEFDSDGSGQAVVSTYLGRNGSKTIAVDCVSEFDEEHFNITGYITVASYTKYDKSVFKINNSTVSTSLCEKQGELFIHSLLTMSDLCLLENNVGITMADLGFINYQ